MRPFHLVSLLLLVVVAVNLRAQTVNHRFNVRVKPPPPPPPVAVAEPPPHQFTGQGNGFSREDAVRLAREKVHQNVLAFLRQQDPPVEWTPSVEELGLTWKQPEEKTLDLKDAPEGPIYQVTVTAELSPRRLREVIEKDRQMTVQARQLLAGKIMALLVAVCVAVGGYFRLDEWTKGFFSRWLRLGAGLLVGAAALALWPKETMELLKLAQRLGW